MKIVIQLIRSDWNRYLIVHKKKNLLLFFMVFFHNPGMLFSILFRIEHYLCMHPFLKGVGFIFQPLYFLITYFILDVDIPPDASIGKGLYIHNKGIIATNFKAGDNLTLIGPLTVGRNFGSSDTPIFGDNIAISAGARVIGNVRIGDYVIIGANAVVIKDVSNNSIVGGIPADKIARISSERYHQYIQN